MRRYIALIVALILLGGAWLVYADQAEQDYRSARTAYRKFLTNVPAQHHRDRWIRHIKRFLTFTEKHPQHERAPDALYIAGDAYTRMARWSGRGSDLREAVKVYDRLARVYPGSSLADDSLIKAALILEKKLEDPSEAYRRYQLCAEQFPEGDQAPKAIDGIARLSDYAPQPAEPEATPAPVEPAAPAPTEATPMPTPVAPAPMPVTITGVAAWSQGRMLRLIVTLSQDVALQQQVTQAAPGSNQSGFIFLTFNQATTAENVSLPDLPAATVHSADLTTNSTGAVLALELAPFSSHRIVRRSNPSRVILEIVFDNGIARTQHNGSSHRTVVIDPGHGGEDLGAHNEVLVEKDVVLKIARLVRDRLQRRRDLTVVMTRDDDSYLPLDVRCAMANDLGADLFVSIHVNASFREASNGVETYIFSPEHPEDNGETVALENKPGHVSAGADLALLSHRYPTERSRILARTVQRHLLARVRGVRSRAANRGVKAAPMYVLMDAHMPAVLVEVGFASHATERKLLIKPSYQQVLADGIAEGIVAYIAQES